MTSWLHLDSGPCPPAFNMALDEALMELAPSLAVPVLRFYGWTEPAATFGYFQHYTEIERLTLLRPLLRRPTGGGLVPHDADWTYSVAFPVGHEWHGVSAQESYRRVHDWLRRAFAELGVPAELAPCSRPGAGQCFIGYEQSDLLWHGRKIAGAAQRRTKTALLIQGSVQPPLASLRRADWQAALRSVASQLWAVEWRELLLPEPSWPQPGAKAEGGDASPEQRLRERADSLLSEKYSRDSHHRKR